jgi:hypothetical protein
MKKAYVLLFVAVFFSVCLAFAVLYRYAVIHNYGVVKTLGCVSDVSYIDWGSIYPDQSKQQVINIKVTGNVKATLSMNTSDWSPPEAEQYFTLSWNYTGEVIEPETTVPLTLTLHVSPDIQNITTFNFTITITAMEVEQ